MLGPEFFACREARIVLLSPQRSLLLRANEADAALQGRAKYAKYFSMALMEKGYS